MCLTNPFLHNVGELDGEPLVARSDALITEPQLRADQGRPPAALVSFRDVAAGLRTSRFLKLAQSLGSKLSIDPLPHHRRPCMNRLALVASLLLSATAIAHAQTHKHQHQHQQMDHQKHMGTLETPRQAEVAQRGPAVMPFNLSATQHIFTKNARGGTQRVVARTPTDTEQVKLVRQHLQEIREQFQRGDFSGPSHIHGQDMPGLAQLKTAQPGQIRIDYQAVTGGAELRYQSAETRVVQALHQWFDAQLSDHGGDAVDGHKGAAIHPPGAHKH